MIPTYLNDLHLDVVLVAYTSNIEAYLQESNGNEHIVDSETLKISGFVTSTFGQPEELELKYFDVQNPNRKDFSLLQIDNGVISSVAPTLFCSSFGLFWLRRAKGSNNQSDIIYRTHHYKKSTEDRRIGV